MWGARQSVLTGSVLPLQLLLWHFTLSVRSEPPMHLTHVRVSFSYRMYRYWFFSFGSLERNNKCYKQKISCGHSGLITYAFKPTQNSFQITCWLCRHPLTSRIRQDYRPSSLWSHAQPRDFLWLKKVNRGDLCHFWQKCLRVVFTCSFPLAQQALNIILRWSLYQSQPQNNYNAIILGNIIWTRNNLLLF